MVTNPFVAENVRRIRERHRLSQEQLADAARVSSRTVQRLEAGAAYAAHTLVEVAAALGTTAEDLEKEPPQSAKKSAPKARWETISLEPIATGRQLVALMTGQHATNFQEIEVEGEDDLDAIAEFQQLVQDWGDLLSDLGPTERRAAERALDESLGTLVSMGLRVAGSVRTYRLGGGTMDGAIWRIAYVVISRKEVSTILRDTHRPIM